MTIILDKGGSMKQWKQLMEKGNQAFHDASPAQAAFYYLSACKRASKLLPHWFDKEAVIAAVAVSYQNYAELHFQFREYEKGIECYRTLSRCLRLFRATQQGNTFEMRLVDCTLKRIQAELLAKAKLFPVDENNCQLLMTEMADLVSRPVGMSASQAYH